MTAAKNLLPKNRFLKILLVGAVVVSLVLRFWKIATLPFPPDGDEVAFGYYGWSLLHFGSDEYGTYLPLSFPSIGDYKYPVLAYLNMVPAALFGPTEITTRFWAAASGVILVPLVYLLSMLIFANPAASVIAGWLIALSPWDVIESRLGYENHVALTITTGALVLFLHFVKKNSQNRRLIFFSLIFFAASSFTYGAQRVFIPLLILSLLAISFLKNSFLKTQRKLLLFTLIILSLVIFVPFLSSANRGRSSEEVWKGISSQEKDRLQQLYVGAGISQIKIPPRATWLFHNKYRIALTDLLDRYLDHFSPKFLFFQGEASNQKIPDMGLLLLIEVVLLPVGLITFLRSGGKHEPLVILAWLAVAPVASALTFGGAHINRASLMVVPLALISGYGFWQTAKLFGGRIRTLSLVVISLGVLGSSLFALNQIFIQKPYDRPWFKEQVEGELAREILKLKGNYRAVVTADDDYIYFLFFGKVSPAEFLAKSEITPPSLGVWERVNRFDNIYFKMPNACPKSGKLNVLYVCAGGDIPKNAKIVKTFYYWDGVPAYSLIEYYPLSKMPAVLPGLGPNLHYMVDVEGNLDFPDGIIPDTYPSFW